MTRFCHIVCMVVLFGFAKIAKGQSTSTVLGARAAGMGNVSSVLTDEWSVFNNIGGIGRVKQSALITAFEARPALTGANRMGAGFLQPLSFGTLAVGVHRFGDDLYREQVLTAGFGNQFENTSLGVNVNYIHYRGEGFGSNSAITFDFGGITQITPRVFVSGLIRNLTQSKLSRSDQERLPTKLIAGVAVKPDETLTLAAELEKDIDYKPTWRAGLEYAVYKKIFFRSGYSFLPSALFFGCGFHKKQLKVDYALQFTERQGAAHQMAATYVIAQKEKQ